MRGISNNTGTKQLDRLLQALECLRGISNNTGTKLCNKKYNFF
nr:MAG TPA: hypothetical protein [Caudoviricetes sp.]